MTSEELNSLITNTLTDLGFTSTSVLFSSDYHQYFTKNQELIKDQTGNLTGHCIEVRKVYCRNSKSDVNYYIEIDRCSGRTISSLNKVKLIHTQTEQTIRRKITEFISEYLKIIL